MTSYKSLRAQSKSQAASRISKIARASGGPVPDKPIAPTGGGREDTTQPIIRTPAESSTIQPRKGGGRVKRR